MKIVCFALIYFFGALSAQADSPLTSTDFSKAYLELCLSELKSKEVNFCKLLSQRKLSPQAAKYLADDKNRIDYRLALVNSFGWDLNGQSNSSVFLGLIKKDEGNLHGDAAVIYGYLMAMDDYLSAKSVNKSLSFVKKGAVKNKSFSVQLIKALVETQNKIADGKVVWNTYKKLLEAYPPNKRDMPAKAVDIVTEYMELYKED